MCEIGFKVTFVPSFNTGIMVATIVHKLIGLHVFILSHDINFPDIQMI